MPDPTIRSDYRFSPGGLRPPKRKLAGVANPTRSTSELLRCENPRRHQHNSEQANSHVSVYDCHDPVPAYSCPANTVSCADLHALAADDGVTMLGGHCHSKAGLHRLGRDPYPEIHISGHTENTSVVQDLLLSMTVGTEEIRIGPLTRSWALPHYQLR